MDSFNADPSLFIDLPVGTEMIQTKTEEEWLALRTEVLTSTDMAALFDMSPYTTLAEVHYSKKNKVELEFQSNERVLWGNKLESAIAHGIAEEKGWKVAPLKAFIQNKEKGIGSSFDFAVLDDELNVVAILEIKNVDLFAFNNGWSEDENGNIEAPPHIEIQCQHQMLLSSVKKLYIGALVGGNKLVLLERDYDPEIGAAIMDKATTFWNMLKAGHDPKPDYIKDADLISRLYGFADPGKIVDMTNAEGPEKERFNELARTYKIASDEIKGWENKKLAARNEMLIMSGDAEKVVSDGFSVSLSVVGEAEIAYTRKSYRSFRINWKKKKE